MQIELLQRKGANDTLATGLLVGLWIGDALAATEYWLLKAGSAGLGAVGWVLRRPFVIVSAPILGCCGLLCIGVSNEVAAARMQTAMLDARSLSIAAELYRADTDQWPVTLEQLVPRYCKCKAVQVDPWGRNYALYRGEGGIATVSAGPDGVLGTADDVISVPPEP